MRVAGSTPSITLHDKVSADNPGEARALQLRSSQETDLCQSRTRLRD